MLPKGFTTFKVSKKTERRLLNLRKQMIAENPDKYDETTSRHEIIIWLLDQVTKNKNHE